MIEPKYRRVEGQTERMPVNLLSNAGVNKKKEQMAVYNKRRVVDKSKLPDFLRTMKFVDDDGNQTEEICCWETDDLTLFGELFFDFFYF